MKPSWDRKKNELKQDAVSIGSLALGHSSVTPEAALLKAAKDAKNKVVYGWEKAFEKATSCSFKGGILLTNGETVRSKPRTEGEKSKRSIQFLFSHPLSLFLFHTRFNIRFLSRKHEGAKKVEKI